MREHDARKAWKAARNAGNAPVTPERPPAPREGFARLIRAGDQWMLDDVALRVGEWLLVNEGGALHRGAFQLFAGTPWLVRGGCMQRLDVPGVSARRVPA